jgi:hypothetical protein
MGYLKKRRKRSTRADAFHNRLRKCADHNPRLLSRMDSVLTEISRSVEFVNLSVQRQKNLASLGDDEDLHQRPPKLSKASKLRCDR